MDSKADDVGMDKQVMKVTLKARQGFKHGIFTDLDVFI